VKKLHPEIISCDRRSGRTYYTGKLYDISSSAENFVPVNYLKKVPSFLTWSNKFHNYEIDSTDA
jgi:hypothetical protein